MLRRFEKKMQVSFFSSIFYEMVYEMARDAQKEKVGGGTEFFMGKEKLGGWDFVGPGTSHFLLGPRYKVCKREGEGFYFYFLLFTFIFSKRLLRH